MYLIMHIMRSEAALISTKVAELSDGNPFFFFLIHKTKIMTVIVCDERKINPFHADFTEDVRIMQAVSSNIATLLFICSR